MGWRWLAVQGEFIFCPVLCAALNKELQYDMLWLSANKVPLFWSEPHFYNADPRYATAVHGLQPNKTLHESVVTVEPVSVHK